MNSYIKFFIIFLFVSCTTTQERSNSIVIDTQKSYPKIQLNIKDIADIEYIKLETDTNCIVNSRPMVYSENYSVILQKGYPPLNSRELEELPRFRVMSWQPFQLPWSASLCLFK